MKKMMLLGMAIPAIALMSSNAFAGADQYPATNFQPQIIYQDDSVNQASAPTVVTDSKYPAAYFQSKVIFKTKQAVPFDPNYPAAYFQPKIIYP